ncbi:MAG: hypothetical protein RIM72_19750 [Alphaproteobacteria bacterium]
MFQTTTQEVKPPLRACLPIEDERLIVSPDFGSVFRQWKEWAGDSGLPLWSCFDPLNHAKLLPHIMLVEFYPDRVEDIRIALSGEHVKEHLGSYPKGTLVRDAMPESNYSVMVEANRFCASRGKAAYFIKTMDWSDRHLMVYELLKLPFVKPDGLVTVVCLMRFDLQFDGNTDISKR